MSAKRVRPVASNSARRAWERSVPRGPGSRRASCARTSATERPFLQVGWHGGSMTLPHLLPPPVFAERGHPHRGCPRRSCADGGRHGPAALSEAAGRLPAWTTGRGARGARGDGHTARGRHRTAADGRWHRRAAPGCGCARWTRAAGRRVPRARRSRRRLPCGPARRWPGGCGGPPRRCSRSCWPPGCGWRGAMTWRRPRRCCSGTRAARAVPVRCPPRGPGCTDVRCPRTGPRSTWSPTSRRRCSRRARYRCRTAWIRWRRCWRCTRHSWTAPRGRSIRTGCGSCWPGSPPGRWWPGR